MALGNPLGTPQGHGNLERGFETTPRSTLFEGRFGRMFRPIPPAEFQDAELEALAGKMSAIEKEITPESAVDEEENFGIPAGYTYLGQFIDHDITFDPLSSLVKQNDPGGLVDFRTPALDLDSLYGRGPDDQPFMYEPDGRTFLLGQTPLVGDEPEREMTRDLPRIKKRAIIGDKRNDENVIVSQLHGLFLRFHNLLAQRMPGASFRQVQQTVRWHYQWIVLFDYLPRIVGRDLVLELMPHLTSRKSIHEDSPKLVYFRWRNDPYMPVEFSAAAFRFGHSMVRTVYRLSAHDLPNSNDAPGLNGRKRVFSANPRDGLNGFGDFPDSWGIDWNLYFDTVGNRTSPNALHKRRVQPSYKIDTSLVSFLSALPEFSQAGTITPKAGEINRLAERNLKRGVRLGLPSGQAVARYMGLTPIPDDALLVGKATVKGLEENQPLATISASFADNAPLWFYILAEAQHQWRTKGEGMADTEKIAVPTTLGPVGGRIIAEVLIGMVWGSKQSFLQLDQNWKPLFGNPEAAAIFDRFTMGDLAQAVMGS